MRRLAASLPADELNGVGFRLYERFRPEVPEGVSGWGAKAELRIDAIERAGDRPWSATAGPEGTKDRPRGA